MANMYPSKKAGGGTPKIEWTTLWSGRLTSFAAQTITLSQSFNNFDYIQIGFWNSTSGSGYGELMATKDTLGCSIANSSRELVTITACLDSSTSYSRTIINDIDYNGTKLKISAAFKLGGSGTNNNYAIPNYVSGGKLVVQ